MRKEKSDKSTTSNVNFPEGVWSVSIRNAAVYIGDLDLAAASQSPEQYNGNIVFGNNPGFGPIKGGDFSVEVVTVDPVAEVIYFKIPAAALQYNSNTSPLYQFIFIGWYCGTNDEPNVMGGSVRIPKDFGTHPGDLGEDGDEVTWIAKGITDPPHKHSR